MTESNPLVQANPTQAVRKALALPEHIPLITVDGDRNCPKSALIAITGLALTSSAAPPR